MKIYNERVRPEEIIKFVDTRKCDICGVLARGIEWEAKSIYDISETEIVVEIRQKTGVNYLEEGFGTKYEIDLCPTCFKKKLIPWLRSQGAVIQEEEWDW